MKTDRRSRLWLAMIISRELYRKLAAKAIEPIKQDGDWP